jgi:hypothetical protein
MGEYLSELELRPFSEIPGYAHDSDAHTSALCLPHRVRYRGRVGRGGRIVMDRLPVRHALSLSPLSLLSLLFHLLQHTVHILLLLSDLI